MSYTFSRPSLSDTEQQPPPKMESHPPLAPPRPVSPPPHVPNKLTEQAGRSPRPGRPSSQSLLLCSQAHTGRLTGPRRPLPRPPSQPDPPATPPPLPPPAESPPAARSSRQPASPARPGVRQETVGGRRGGGAVEPLRTSTFDAPPPPIFQVKNARSLRLSQPTGSRYRYPKPRKTKIARPIMGHKRRETAAQYACVVQIAQEGCAGARVAPSPRRGKRGG